MLIVSRCRENNAEFIDDPNNKEDGKMKKTIMLFMAVMMLFAVLTGCEKKTVKEGEGNDPVPTEEETAKVEALLKDLGYGGKNFKAEYVYNGKDEPQYILASSDEGYLFYDTKREEICETAGAPFTLYKEYEGYKKYYAGPLEYYVKVDAAEGKYLNIIKKTYTDSIPTPVFGQ